MTALAMRSAAGVNAVSQLHGEVTREMWAPLIHELPPQPEPIKAVTNGVHLTNWLSLELNRTLDKYLPSDWRARHDDPSVWDAVLDIPDEVLWETREKMRGYMWAPRLDNTEALQTEALHFIDCIEHNKQPETDGAAGLRMVNMIEAAETSLRNRGNLVEIHW